MKKTLLLALFGLFWVIQPAWAEELQITKSDKDQESPAISGDNIVWEDYRNGDADIYLYNLKNKKEIRITINGSDQGSPAISGDNIVWEDYRNGDADIYFYNLNAKKEIRITDNGADQGSPAISGDNIVWEDWRNGHRDIYLYNLGANQENQITADSATQMSPAISGDSIVWEDERHGNSDVYFYNLKTKKETRITDNGGSQENPAISGDKIVWEDDRSGRSYDVYLYNLKTQKETQVTVDGYDQYSPAISGDNIVWWDYRNDNRDIYLANVSTSKPIYRFWSDEQKAHFYTMNKSEKEFMERTYPQNVWRYEGVGYQSFDKEAFFNTPIYRFWSDTNRKHFYTMSKAERDMIINGAYPEAKWKYEGIAWYAEKSKKSNNKPVYRFYSQNKKAHFFTISKAEKERTEKIYPEEEWRYEGIAWYGR